MNRTRLDSLTDILAFVARHGKADSIGGNASWRSRCDGETIAVFSDGATLTVITDYDGDYSELTPGEGFTIEFWGEE